MGGPVLLPSCPYKVVVEFEVSPGTWDARLSKAATHPSAAELIPDLPAFEKGMMVARVNLERGGVVSILLGNSDEAISEFNSRVVVIRKVE